MQHGTTLQYCPCQIFRLRGRSTWRRRTAPTTPLIFTITLDLGYYFLPVFFNLGLPSATFAFRAFALNPIRNPLNENYSICKWNSICIHIHASCQDQNPFNQAPYCRYERKKAKRQDGNQQLSNSFPSES